jgi:hypothetical protein
MKRKNIFTVMDELFMGFDEFLNSSPKISFGGYLTNGSDSNFPTDGDKNYNKVEEVVETETHKTKKEIWTSVDGNSKFERIVSESKAQKPLPPTKEELTGLLNKAVEAQDFEKAIELRDQLSKLK